MVQAYKSEPVHFTEMVQSAQDGRSPHPRLLHSHYEELGKMKRIWRTGWFPVVLSCLVYPAYTQSLFESSQQGYHENQGASNNLTLGGFIRSAGYVAVLPESQDYYFQSAYAQAGLLMNAYLGDLATAKADIRFRAGSEFQEPVSEWLIREAYVSFSSAAAGIRLGKMITPGGKGTVFNPTGKITPLDPTRRSPEEDDLLLGYWAAEGHLNLGPFIKLTGTWKPLYQSSVMLIDPVPMPEYVKFIEPWDPGVRLSEGSYGINLDLHLPAIDAGFYWFDGYHHWPGIAFKSVSLDMVAMEPELLELQEHPYRIRMAGLDFSIPLASWIFRAEGAWQQSVDDSEELEYVPFPELSYTAEIERSLSPVTLIGGYYGKYILEFSEAAAPPSLSPDQDYFVRALNQDVPFSMETIDELIREQIRSFNRLYNYQLENYYHQIYLVLRGDFLYEKIECALPVIYNFTTREWIVQPQVIYRPLDGLEVCAGFSGLYGPANSLYDLVGPVLNAGYISMKVTF
jgi:hypothetical protein